MEHTHTNKILYVSIAVVLAIIIVLALIHFWGGSSTAPEQIIPPTLVDQMTAPEPAHLTAAEQRALEQSMTASAQSTLSEKERAALRKAMTAQP